MVGGRKEGGGMKMVVEWKETRDMKKPISMRGFQKSISEENGGRYDAVATE